MLDSAGVIFTFSPNQPQKHQPAGFKLSGNKNPAKKIIQPSQQPTQTKPFAQSHAGEQPFPKKQPVQLQSITQKQSSSQPIQSKKIQENPFLQPQTRPQSAPHPFKQPIQQPSTQTKHMPFAPLPPKIKPPFPTYQKPGTRTAAPWNNPFAYPPQKPPSQYAQAKNLQDFVPVPSTKPAQEFHKGLPVEVIPEIIIEEPTEIKPIDTTYVDKLFGIKKQAQNLNETLAQIQTEQPQNIPASVASLLQQQYPVTGIVQQPIQAKTIPEVSQPAPVQAQPTPVQQPVVAPTPVQAKPTPVQQPVVTPAPVQAQPAPVQQPVISKAPPIQAQPAPVQQPVVTPAPVQAQPAPVQQPVVAPTTVQAKPAPVQQPVVTSAPVQTQPQPNATPAPVQAHVTTQQSSSKEPTKDQPTTLTPNFGQISKTNQPSNRQTEAQSASPISPYTPEGLILPTQDTSVQKKQKHLTFPSLFRKRKVSQPASVQVKDTSLPSPTAQSEMKQPEKQTKTNEPEEVLKPRLSIKKTAGIALIVLAIVGLTVPVVPKIMLERTYAQLKKGEDAKLAYEQERPLPASVPYGFNPMMAPDGTIVEPVNTEFSIVIPAAGINAPVLAGIDPLDSKSYLPALKKGVAHAKTSYFPNQQGSVYLFSHSTNYEWFVNDLNAVFYNVKNLQAGQYIIVFYEGKRYVYEYKESKVVPPKDTAELIPEAGKRELILQTCWPPGSVSERLLLYADLAEVS